MYHNFRIYGLNITALRNTTLLFDPCATQRESVADGIAKVIRGVVILFYPQQLCIAASVSLFAERCVAQLDKEFKIVLCSGRQRQRTGFSWQFLVNPRLQIGFPKIRVDVKQHLSAVDVLIFHECREPVWLALHIG